MKQLIKKIIPTSFLRVALNVYDKRKLNTVPKKSFDISHLKNLHDLNLSSIFSDKDIEETWRRDHESITALLGNNYIFDGINPGDRRALYYLIMALKPKKVLEVGTHIGASTLYIARALKNISSKANITTVDILDVNAEQAPWKKLGLEMSPKSSAHQLKCLEHITFKASPAENFMQDTDERYDFIFLDGDHSAKAVYKEVSLALKLLNHEGIIVLHDYYPERKPLFSNGNIIAGPFRALDRIKNERNNLCVQALGELPWPTKLGSNTTSLAIVTKN